MANPTFAELKEKFKNMNANPYPKPAAPTINNESPLDPSISEKSERLKTANSNQPLESTNPTISDSTVSSSSQPSNETSSSREAILARIRQQSAIGSSGFKKAPVPLPQLASQHQNENTLSESSSLPQDTTLSRVLPLDGNTFAGRKKSPVPLPTSDQNENPYCELSDVVPHATSSSSVPQDTTSYEGFVRPIVSLPTPIKRERHDSVPSESLSVSLDAMLPSKCMFSEFENMINGYQRRDPRTIIYPKVKATMPKMTTDEINILQRYSNT